MTLTGKRAVVIGGATGIGSGICRALVARGATVDLCDIDEAGASALAEEMGSNAVSPHRCDVTDPASLAALEASLRAKGDIDLLFVNAGGIVLKPFTETTDADYRWLFDVNFFGTVNVVRAFLSGLLAQTSRSRMIVTSSVAALRTPPMPGQTIYMASKSAQLGFCNGLRIELEGTSVGLTVLMPGPVRSQLRAKSEDRRPGSIELVVPPGVGASGYLEPEAAGERIVSEVEKGKPYITTHPAERDLVREAQDLILTAFEP